MFKHKNKERSHSHSAVHKRIKPLHLSFVGVISLLILFTAVFTVTRGDVPFSSELSYIEHSILGKNAGSVVPASCESGAEHTAGECACYGVVTCGICGNPACCVTNVGASCSPANVCGRTNTGTIQCAGACSVSAPDNSTCIPTDVTISATVNVGAGKNSTVTWSSANDAAGCEIVKRTFRNIGDTGGDPSVVNASVGASGSLLDGPLPVPATVQGEQVPLGGGYYVAYKARCWDSSGTMFSGYSNEAVTTVGSARLWFTP